MTVTPLRYVYRTHPTNFKRVVTPPWPVQSHRNKYSTPDFICSHFTNIKELRRKGRCHRQSNCSKHQSNGMVRHGMGLLKWKNNWFFASCSPIPCGMRWELRIEELFRSKPASELKKFLPQKHQLQVESNSGFQSLIMINPACDRCCLAWPWTAE